MPLSKIDSDSLTAPLTVPAGSAAAPAITTTGDVNTGIFFPAADTIAFAEGGAEVARFDSAGNMGIGTTTPDDITTNYTTVDVRGSVGGGLRLGVAAGNNMALYASATTSVIEAAGSAPLQFVVNASERARINSSGVLMVNTTDQDAQINTTPTTNQFTFRPDDGIRCSITGTNFFTRSGDGTIFNFRRNATTVGTISVSTGATAYNTSSDYRLKEAIVPMTGALAKVAALKPCTYKWKVDGSDGQGFIAHELQEVVEGCVTGAKDAVETYTDEDGNEATRPVYQGIDTSFLVATLTAAIQELKAIVDAQGAEIAALKGTP